jgi:hypothetical protein
MNHFLKYYKKHYQTTSLFEAAKGAGDCYILLMPVEGDLIVKAERVLRVFQKPKFNTLETRRQLFSSIPLDTSIGDALRCNLLA